LCERPRPPAIVRDARKTCVAAAAAARNRINISNAPRTRATGDRVRSRRRPPRARAGGSNRLNRFIPRLTPPIAAVLSLIRDRSNGKHLRTFLPPPVFCTARDSQGHRPTRTEETVMTFRHSRAVVPARVRGGSGEAERPPERRPRSRGAAPDGRPRARPRSRALPVASSSAAERERERILRV
jgi:hypothetical protein